jgi:hypothetical protein
MSPTKRPADWISSEDALAMTIALGVCARGCRRSDVETVRRYLDKFADSLELSHIASLLETRLNDEQHSRATRFQKRLHRMKQTLGLKGSESTFLFHCAPAESTFPSSRVASDWDFDERDTLETLKPSAL